jgi:hypothetical protein
MDKQKWTMVTRLEYLAAGGEPSLRFYGICWDVDAWAEDIDSGLLSLALSTHPEAGGRHMYPIPHPEGMSPSRAYWDIPDLWIGEYGALRRDFAAHAAKYLREKGYV